jgi:uracil-DNA glycosylase family 4
LVEWRKKSAQEKRAAYADEPYWGKPLPGWGDPNARILIVGLAPAAHGANRTGRMFTGDRSGDWLYRAMHRARLANKPNSVDRKDGLKLIDSYVTAIVRCAPPANKPTTQERDNCLPFLADEMRLLRKVRVIIALGKFAWDGLHRSLLAHGHESSTRTLFAHGATTTIGPYRLIASYHPSQQNTFTGRLTESMLDSVFRKARAWI